METHWQTSNPITNDQLTHLVNALKQQFPRVTVNNRSNRTKESNCKNLKVNPPVRLNVPTKNGGYELILNERATGWIITRAFDNEVTFFRLKKIFKKCNYVYWEDN